MADVDDRTLAIIDAFIDRRQSILDRTISLVLGAFTGMSNWYAPTPQRQALQDVAKYLSVGRIGTASLTDAYLSAINTTVQGRTFSPAGVPAAFQQTLRMGVRDDEQVYERIAAEYRRQRALGKNETRALDIAYNRAHEMVSEDLGLAHQHQVRRFNERRNITTYRRVIRGEGTCGLCVVASDRVYYKKDLMPIHARCRCTVMAVTGKSDPGSLVNDQIIGDLYEAAGSTYGKDLKRTKVEVFQHGELGPQLRVAGQHIRRPAEVAEAA